MTGPDRGTEAVVKEGGDVLPRKLTWVDMAAVSAVVVAGKKTWPPPAAAGPVVVGLSLYLEGAAGLLGGSWVYQARRRRLVAASRAVVVFPDHDRAAAVAREGGCQSVREGGVLAAAAV